MTVPHNTGEEMYNNPPQKTFKRLWLKYSKTPHNTGIREQGCCLLSMFYIYITDFKIFSSYNIKLENTLSGVGNNGFFQYT